MNSLRDQLNEQTKNKKSVTKANSDLKIEQILNPIERIKLKLLFSSTRQIEFIGSLMRIKEEGEGVNDLAVIKRMQVIYQKSKALGKVSHLACEVVIVRMESGADLGDAMLGVFSDSFSTLISAAKSSSNITHAIKSATDRQSVIVRVEIMSTLKIYVGLIAILVSGNFLHLVENFYLSQKAINPKPFKFFEEPSFDFAIADFIATFTIPLALLMISVSIINRWLLPRASGEMRELVDSYYPPAKLFRGKLAMNMFSNIALLIKDAGVQPRLAIDKLLVNAKPYETDHLIMIKNAIVEGEDGTDQFSTGLLPENLELRLELAAQGEKSSIKTALDIICNSGQEDIINTSKRLSTIIMLTLVLFAVNVALSSVSVGFYVFKSLGS